MGVIARQTCRVCGAGNLKPILSLGEQYISDFIDSKDEQGIKVPLELVLCEEKSGGCGLLQLKHTTPPEILYSNQYWYQSAISSTMVIALKDIVNQAEKLIPLKEGDIVIDIGANDGTLLRHYTNKQIKTVGFEPAKNLVPIAQQGTIKIINDFFNFESFNKNFPNQKAKIITAIAMFYDLEDPNKFVSDIAKCLDKDGVWLVQMAYLPTMLKDNTFDNICHEHLEYYSLLSTQNLLKRHNLEVFDVELNDINGGSFRLYIKHKYGKVNVFPGAQKRVDDLKEYEEKLRLDDAQIYNEFANRVKQERQKLLDFLNEELKKGKNIYIYGASTKGNTLLQYYNLNNTHIKAATDKNKDKHGKLTVGSLIPIIPVEQYRQNNPDYLLLLPWHFLREIKEQEREFLQKGGKIIVPLPEFRVVGL